MADVVVTLTGNEVALLRAMQKIIDKQGQVDDGFRKNKKTAQEAAEAQKRIGEGISNVGRDVAGLATGYLTVSTAVQVVNAYISEQVALQRESLELARTFAREQQEAAKNLTGLSNPTVAATLGPQLEQIALRQGFADLGALASATGSGFSASGGNLDLTLASVEAAAALTRLTPDQVGTVAAGSIDIGNAVGSAAADRNLGFLLNAGAAARIDDPVKLAQTLAPTVAAGVKSVPGQDAQQAAAQSAALFTNLTLATTDKEGSNTRSAVVKLQNQLREFFGQAGQTDPGTLFGRVEALQADTKKRDEFLAAFPADTNFKIAIENLLTGGSDLAKAVKASGDAITFSADAYQAKVEQLQTVTPQIALASQGTAFEAAVNVSKSRDTAGAAIAQINEIYTTTLRDSSATFAQFLGGGLARLGAGVDAATADSPLGFAANRITSLRDRQANLLAGGVTDDEQRKLDLVNAAIDSLARIAEQFAKQQAQLTAEQDKQLANVRAFTEASKQNAKAAQTNAAQRQAAAAPNN